MTKGLNDHQVIQRRRTKKVLEVVELVGLDESVTKIST